MTFTPPAPPSGPTAAILAAGHRLVADKGTEFTTHDLVKEAGVALQTFYRHFGGKDQLLLALIAEQIRGHCARLVESADARGISDPVARLELHIRTTLTPLRTPTEIAGAQFVTSEHWRLNQLFPTELAAATQPFTDLVRSELEAAGLPSPRPPARDAWLVTKTVLGAYHDAAFRPDDPLVATVAEDVCGYCLAAVGVPAGRNGDVDIDDSPT